MTLPYDTADERARREIRQCSRDNYALGVLRTHLEIILEHEGVDACAHARRALEMCKDDATIDAALGRTS